MFQQLLYHGSSTRYGTLKSGEWIRPGITLGIDSVYNKTLLPNVSQYAHATIKLKDAVRFGKDTAECIPGTNWEAAHDNHQLVVYMVHAVSDMQDDEYWEGSFVSKIGFQVLKLIMSEIKG